MYLIQILLPLTDNAGRPYDREAFRNVQRELVAQFGGATAYTRAPADGRWKSDDGELVRDEIVICEVMAAKLDRSWWKRYRASLAAQFGQEELVVRANEIELL